MELLFVSSRSKDAWSCKAINLESKQKVWSCKGHEWDGLTIQCTRVVAGQYLAVATLEKPILSMISLCTTDRKHIRSILPAPCRTFAVTKSGDLLSASLTNAPEMIYTWNLQTGHLVNMVSCHFQCITHLQFTDDGCFLVSAAADGQIIVWLVSDLVSCSDTSVKTVEPFRKWSAHGLAVNQFCITKGGPDVRIVSCSTDQTVKIHSIASDECLCTLMIDAQITACCMDSGETRLFIGTVDGSIAPLNLYQQPAVRERQISTIGDSTDCPIFKGHTAAVLQMHVSMDVSMLASGDKNGQIKLWHILSHQCLHTFEVKGPVCDLHFSVSWPSIVNPKYTPSLPLAVLQKQLIKEIPHTIPLLIGRESDSLMKDVEQQIFDKKYEKSVEYDEGGGDSEGGLIQENQPNLNKKRKRSSKKKEKRQKIKILEGAEITPAEDVDVVEDSDPKPETNKEQKVNKALYQFLADQVLREEPALNTD